MEPSPVLERVVPWELALWWHHSGLGSGTFKDASAWGGVVEVWILLPSTWGLLAHRYPLARFSLVCLWYADDKPGAQWFSFSSPKSCQLEASSNSRVGGPSSSHFHKVPLKTTCGCRGKTFFLTQLICFDNHASPWWWICQGETLSYWWCSLLLPASTLGILLVAHGQWLEIEARKSMN